MSIKFRVLGGVLGGGGGSADFIFMGARIFLNFRFQLLNVPKSTHIKGPPETPRPEFKTIHNGVTV